MYAVTRLPVPSSPRTVTVMNVVAPKVARNGFDPGGGLPRSRLFSGAEAFDELLHDLEGGLGSVVIGGEPEPVEQS